MKGRVIKLKTKKGNSGNRSRKAQEVNKFRICGSSGSELRETRFFLLKVPGPGEVQSSTTRK